MFVHLTDVSFMFTELCFFWSSRIPVIQGEGFKKTKLAKSPDQNRWYHIFRNRSQRRVL